MFFNLVFVLLTYIPTAIVDTCTDTVGSRREVTSFTIHIVGIFVVPVDIPCAESCSLHYTWACIREVCVNYIRKANNYKWNFFLPITIFFLTRYYPYNYDLCIFLEFLQVLWQVFFHLDNGCFQILFQFVGNRVSVILTCRSMAHFEFA